MTKSTILVLLFNSSFLFIDQAFGDMTAWKEVFFDNVRGMVLAPDESIFVANQTQHNISKFDKDGNLLKIIGREEGRPGDLFYPGDISILDSKYVAVRYLPHIRNEGAVDMNGKFKQLVKIEKPPSCIVSIKDNTAACTSGGSEYVKEAQNDIYYG